MERQRVAKENSDDWRVDRACKTSAAAALPARPTVTTNIMLHTRQWLPLQLLLLLLLFKQ
jgi:hypothetical protein